MDQIESQASELDSFLAGSSTIVNVAPVGLLGSMAGASSGPAPAPAPAPARRGGDARGAGGSASSAGAGSLQGGLAHYAPSHSRHSAGVGSGSGQARTTSITTAPYSALGPGSAPHHSPTTSTPTSTTTYHHPHQQASHIQHAANNHVINRSQALSASPGAVDAASGPGSGAGSVSAGAKRRAEASAEDAAQKQQRSKRNRYISIACNECKRRKIKCNGETPCARCGNFRIQCLYAPNCCSNSFRESDEFKQMSDSLSNLQEQMTTLQLKMNALQQETLRLAPLHDRVLPPPTTNSHSRPSPSTSTSSLHRPEVPSFKSPVHPRGPTSASAHVNVAKNTFHNMFDSGGEGHEDSGNVMTGDDPVVSPPVSTSLRDYAGRPADPLWDFDKEEMIRLCKFHEVEVGIMYPVVNIKDVMAHANYLCNIRDPGRKYGLTSSHLGGHAEVATDIKTLELKIIMCCALVVEGLGHSAKADRLWESLQPIADKMLMSDPADVTNLPFLALVGGYRFLANEEVLAWRVMGQVCRLCMEMGLHRQDGIARIEGEQERKNATNTFWSAYVLDRRWSFGTGYPFTVADDKIDPSLPLPDEYPYLKSLIYFARVSSKIWNLIDYFEPVLIRNLKPEEFETLDREILEWYDTTVPDHIRIHSLGYHIPIPGTDVYNEERLQIWTRLRLNQIRIWLYTPVLHTHTSITENEQKADLVVSLARETIEYLSLLNKNSEIYRRIQVFYHQFLTSAIAVLFLASAHAPLMFSSQCREQFHMALDLVKDLAGNSRVSHRLWTTVEGLKAYAARLGLGRRDIAAPTSAGMAAGSRHNSIQYTSQRGSVSSGDHHPSPSPGLTPGSNAGHHHQQQQHMSSNMGSMTPRAHGGMNSPRSSIGGGVAQSRGDQRAVAHGRDDDDANNGLRLRTDLSRAFEEFAHGPVQGQYYHGGGVDELSAVQLGEYSAGGGGGADFAPGEVHVNLSAMFRDMF